MKNVGIFKIEKNKEATDELFDGKRRGISVNLFLANNTPLLEKLENDDIDFLKCFAGNFLCVLDFINVEDIDLITPQMIQNKIESDAFHDEESFFGGTTLATIIELSTIYNNNCESN